MCVSLLCFQTISTHRPSSVSYGQAGFQAEQAVLLITKLSTVLLQFRMPTCTTCGSPPRSTMLVSDPVGNPGMRLLESIRKVTAAAIQQCTSPLKLVFSHIAAFCDIRSFGQFLPESSIGSMRSGPLGTARCGQATEGFQWLCQRQDAGRSWPSWRGEGAVSARPHQHVWSKASHRALAGHSTAIHQVHGEQ